jgi:ubiquinone/menaquinone biosynthesis C-methylase UbiE
MSAREPVPANDDARVFHDFEQEGWEAAAAAYASGFSALTVQGGLALLAYVEIDLDERLLDVACGPGWIAHHARQNFTPNVVGVDFSSAMLAVARKRHPKVDFRQADAEALPFDDASFDIVTMGFLVGHLARPEVAMAEAYRVLVPRGRVAFSWWQPPDRAVGFGFVYDAVRAHGRMDVDIPKGPPFDRYCDSGTCAELLRGAGFVEPTVHSQDMTWLASSGDSVFETFLNGTVRSAALLRAQTPEALRKIRAEVVAKVEAFTEDGKITLPTPCWIAVATKR